MDASEGLGILLVIAGCTIGRVVPVPGGNVNSHLEAVLTAGLRELPDDISLPAAPGAFPYGVLALRIRPQTEPVMVLCSQDDAFETRSPGDGGPLPAVKGAGIEKAFRLTSESPFQTAESVWAEMDEKIHFHLLPLQLGLCGYGAVGQGRLTAGSCNDS